MKLQDLYNNGAPEYYSGNTYLGPNQANKMLLV